MNHDLTYLLIKQICDPSVLKLCKHVNQNWYNIATSELKQRSLIQKFIDVAYEFLIDEMPDLDRSKHSYQTVGTANEESSLLQSLGLWVDLYQFPANESMNDLESDSSLYHPPGKCCFYLMFYSIIRDFTLIKNRCRFIKVAECDFDKRWGQFSGDFIIFCYGLKWNDYSKVGYFGASLDSSMHHLMFDLSNLHKPLIQFEKSKSLEFFENSYHRSDDVRVKEDKHRCNHVTNLPLLNKRGQQWIRSDSLWLFVGTKIYYIPDSTKEYDDQIFPMHFPMFYHPFWVFGSRDQYILFNDEEKQNFVVLDFFNRSCTNVIKIDLRSVSCVFQPEYPGQSLNDVRRSMNDGLCQLEWSEEHQQIAFRSESHLHVYQLSDNKLIHVFTKEMKHDRSFFSLYCKNTDQNFRFSMDWRVDDCAKKTSIKIE